MTLSGQTSDFRIRLRGQGVDDMATLLCRVSSENRLGGTAWLLLVVIGLGGALCAGPASAAGEVGASIASAGQMLYAPSTARFGGPRQIQLGVKVLF